MKTYLRHPATITALVFFGLIVLFLLFLPLGSKIYLTHWLTKNGADKATIEKLNFNPFNGTLTLNGVLVQTGDTEPIRHDTLIVDLGLGSLFKKNVLIERITYRDLYFEMEQYDDGSWRYGSYTLKSDPAIRNQSAQETIEQASANATPWALAADMAVLENCTIHFKTPALDFTISVDQALLDNFSTRGGQPDGTLSLTGSVNGSPVTLDLSSLRISPELFFEGKIQIDEFGLDNLQTLLQDVFPTFAGKAGINGQATFSLNREGEMVVDYDGVIAGTGIEMRSEPYSNAVPEVNWQGKVKYTQGAANPILIKTDGTLTANDISLEVPAASLTLSDGSLKKTGTATISISDGVAVDTDGELNVSTIQMAIGDMSFNEESIDWQGVVHYSSGSEIPMTVQTDGVLEGSQIGIQIPAAQLAIPAVDLKLTGKAKVTIDDLVAVDHEGTLGTNIASMEFAQLAAKEHQLNWTGKLHWDSESVGNLAIAGDADSNLASLNTGGSTPISIGFENINFVGLQGEGISNFKANQVVADSLNASISGKMPLNLVVENTKIDGLQLSDLKDITAKTISLTQFSAASEKAGNNLATFESLKLDTVSASTAPSFDTETVALQNISYLPATGKSGHDFLKLASLMANSIHYDAENLNGTTIKLSDLLVDMRREKDGAMYFSKRMADMQSGTPPSTEETKSEDKQQPTPESPAIHIKFDSIEVGGNSSLAFKDQSLTKPYSTELKLSELKISEVDSARKDKQLDLNLKGTFEKVAPFSISGTATPFTREKNSDLEISLKNYPLKSLSPYTIESVGTALASGSLKVKSDLKLKGNTLELQNDLHLEQIKTSTVDPALAAQLDKKLPVPLDAALGMLSDSKGNIDLQIPVEGKLDDLDIGIGDVVVTALSKSIVSAASSYFLYALGPYGALAYVGMKVGEGLLDIQLPTVPFTAGSADIIPEQIDYLDRIATILKEKPNMDLYIKPHVSPWEVYTKREMKKYEGGQAIIDDEIQQRLDALAAARVNAIKDYLVKTHAVSTDRLLSDTTSVELKKDGKIEVGLEIR
ncbi:DUF748 domain-containing protein [Desulfosediminicola ganghwensis]|uniref:DUF748 domain-containing protein n=1 Tax=Desulfosediminicola ganghwensis TaxID=2569540 RepID=UPI0010ABCA6B|nr:DUF748 domain-containing protein [Desulfosediminicola ganghwensis]